MKLGLVLVSELGASFFVVVEFVSALVWELVSVLASPLMFEFVFVLVLVFVFVFRMGLVFVLFLVFV